MNEKSKVAIEERHKSTKEIYNETYPREEILENPLIALEAIGWLKCTEQYIPSLSSWVYEEITFLLTVVVLYFIETRD